MKDSIEVKRELRFDDLDDFFWSGARDRWNDATDEQKEMVWDRILEIFVYGDESIPSETDINDLVWFDCDDIFFPEEDEEDDDDMDESRRRRNVCRVIESKRKKKYNEVMYFDKDGNYLFGKEEKQKRAEELADRLFASKNIDPKDIDVFTVDSGLDSYIHIRENKPSNKKYRNVIGIISLYHKDNVVTVSASDKVDRIKLKDGLNTSDTVEISELIQSSPEFDLLIQEYKNSQEDKTECIHRDILRVIESKRRNVRRNSKKEAVVIGAANEDIANNIDLVVQNEYRFYKQMKALVDNLVKKASKGIDLDKDKLAKSSVVDQLVRDSIRYLQKEDHEGDNEGTFDYISTATRNLAKQSVAETILRKVEDAIRYANVNK